MIKNLGRALTIIANAEAACAFIDADLAAFHAPGECYEPAHRGDTGRQRQARRHAEAVARRPMRIIEREALKRGQVAVGFRGPMRAQCRWSLFTGRVYERRYGPN